MTQEWIIEPPWAKVGAAAERWGVPPLVAQVLHNRGIELDDSPVSFLAPQMRDLIPPDELPGARAAAKMIAEAARAQEKIVIYGDYDVDGITGIASLWHVLQAAGANISFYIPHRIDEGYGLSVDAIRTLISEGANLIVSVDCGITGVEAAEAARQAGGRLIITDHHQPGETIPEAAAIVHPTVGGSYANEHLCGSGVAFKLAWAVAQELSGSERVSDAYRGILHDSLAFAALGTIADVVPLVGENRIIARYGLAMIPQTRFVGLRVLIEATGLTGAKLSAYDVGFKLGPRLNAAGRMGHARLAVELLTRADEARAREIALYLEDQNRSRRSVERKITTKAIEMVEREGFDSDAHRAIVLAHEDWHAGVIGIVASRLVDRFRRPAILISLSKKVGQGSGRSIHGLDMADSLSQCSEHLVQYGGHAMAGGLKIAPEKVSAFAEAFGRIASKTLTAANMRKKLRIDAEVALSALDFRTTEALLGLGPFGAGNPLPRLATDWIELAQEPRCVGKSGDHVQAVFTDGRAVLKAIAFGQSDRFEELKAQRRCRVAFKPLINEFNGNRTVEMDVLDFQFA